MKPVQIIGSYLSPYVRKVLVVLDLKRIAYEIDPIVPFLGDDRFSALSPLRRIPVLIDDAVTLADSTVICEYLEERHPEPALLPARCRERARARWLEEFADTRMGEVFIWRLFNQVAIRPTCGASRRDAGAGRARRCRRMCRQFSTTSKPRRRPRVSSSARVGRRHRARRLLPQCRFARFAIDAARWPRTAA